MCIKYIIILWASLTTCLGSHFRGTVFSWRPKDNINEIEVLYRISWRRSGGYFCNESTISSGTVFSSGSLSCLKNCNGAIGVLNYLCTDFSETEDWTTGRGSFTYTFPSSNSYYEFGFTGGAWISLVTFGGGNWELRVKANLAPRTDTGRVNSAPQVDISPTVRLIHGCHHTIWIPVSDPDGDEVRCRWANSMLNECASICNAFTGAVLNETSCTVTFDAIGSIGYYGVAIQVEDFTPGSTTPLSSVPIQFLVYVYNITSGCNSIPEFLPPTRPDRDTVIVNQNGTFTDVIVARSRIPNTDIKEITTISPSGLSKSVLMPHPTIPGAWYIEVTWNPTQKFSNQTYVFCFSATDKSGLTSEQRCMSIVEKNDVNECDSIPCQNGGTCTNTLGSYLCNCSPGWTGKNCPDDINECDFDPCENGGNCTNEYGSYFCNCSLGWTGKNCSFDINECDTSPCKNDGTCINTDGSYFCKCSIGWDGTHCSDDIDECAYLPCEHGECSNTAGSYSCDCQIGWRGRSCADVQLEMILPLILLPLAILVLLIFALVKGITKIR
ncbi:hypothetical protein ACJMK2_028114 [Sinanodonta woodiana]|uniref:EGF-like domain-containing protein n=1 Tax=Sinanodonta woodiana TaxID=1069815 RepID=A0ABD3XA12_SINWO